MATTSSSLSRLADEWAGLGSLFEGRVAPEVVRMFDLDRIRVEELHEDDRVVVRAELPGVDPETDIEISVIDGALEIRAHREQREETQEAGRVRSEFRYGSFMRRVPLPAGVSDEDITATYRDGILEVHVPITPEDEAARPARIPVTRT